MKDHAYDRLKERIATRPGMVEAMTDPMAVIDRGYNERGERSNKRIGRRATVVVNPDTGVIVTCWETGKRERRKYGEDV